MKEGVTKPCGYHILPLRSPAQTPYGPVMPADCNNFIPDFVKEIQFSSLASPTPPAAIPAPGQCPIAMNGPEPPNKTAEFLTSNVSETLAVDPKSCVPVDSRRHGGRRP